jgi:hypothetical protein
MLKDYLCAKANKNDAADGFNSVFAKVSKTASYNRAQVREDESNQADDHHGRYQRNP